MKQHRTRSPRKTLANLTALLFALALMLTPAGALVPSAFAAGGGLPAHSTPTAVELSENGLIQFQGYYAANFTITIYKNGETAGTSQAVKVPASENFVSGQNLLPALRTIGEGTYTVTVRADADETHSASAESSLSNALVLEKLTAPVIRGWQGKTAVWKAAEGANSYSVQLYRGGAPLGSPVTVGAVKYTFPSVSTGDAFTVTSVADTATRFFDSPPSAGSGEYTDALRLSFDPEALPKGVTERFIVEGPDGCAIDEITYSYDASKVTVDRDGNISVAPGYSPAEGEQVTVQATVKYYENPKYFNGFENGAGFTNNADRVDVRGDSLSTGGQASRTGRYGGTTKNTSGNGANTAIPSPAAGKLVFWYYDPFDEEELASTHTGATKLGICVNAYGSGDPAGTNFAGIGYNNDAPATNKPYYVYRTSGANWLPTAVARSRGWHKFVFDVTAEGMTLYIDGTRAYGPVTTIKTVTGLMFANNWGNQTGNQSYINAKHFIDDIYVLASGAELKTATLSRTITLAPKRYSVSPGQPVFDLANPRDVDITVEPDLTDLTYVDIGGAALAADADYTVSGKVLTLLKTGYVSSLEAGSYTLSLHMGGQIVPATLLVVNNLPRKYYVNSQTGDDSADGRTEATAWKSLTNPNATVFNPGDEILLHAESVWNGQLVLRGSGSEGKIITLGKYGSDDPEKRPVINGSGTIGQTVYNIIPSSEGEINQKQSAAVELHNASYWEISGLEVTNMGEAAQNGRNGIMVMNNYAPTAAERTAANWLASKQTHVYIRDCYVHDVNGKHQGQGGIKHAGGIIFYGYVADALVEGCKVVRVDNEGIRNTIFHPGGTDSAAGYPSDSGNKVVFRNNYVAQVSGDAIVMSGVVDGEMSYNVVTDCGRSYVTGRDGKPLAPGAEPALLSTHNYAAAWFMGSKHTVAQYNEVFNNPYVCPDGEAFDIDLFCDNVVYQYNYSHHNAGGVCLFMGSATNSAFRYNISLEDGSTANRPHLFYYAVAGSTTNNAHPKIYNNVFSLASGVNNLFDAGSANAGYLHFQNNILYSRYSAYPTLMYSNSYSVSNGEFSNNIIYPQALYEKLMPRVGAGVLSAGNTAADPLFAGEYAIPEGVITGNLTSGFGFDSSRLAMFKLAGTSPAIDAGVRVDYWPGVAEDKRIPLARDFFGNALTGTELPDIGAHEYSNENPIGYATVTFDGNGADIDAEPTEMTVVIGNLLGVLPVPPVRYGYIFDGWYENADGTGARITADTVVYGDMTAYARWRGFGPGEKAGMALTSERNFVVTGEPTRLSLLDVWGDGRKTPADIGDIFDVTYSVDHPLATVDADGYLSVPAGVTGTIKVTASVRLKSYVFSEGFETASDFVNSLPQNFTRSTERAHSGSYGLKMLKTSAGSLEGVKSFGEKMSGVVTIMYYDDISTAKPRMAAAVNNDSAQYNLGVYYDGTTNGRQDNYSYRNNSGTWLDTGIPRSTGWHELKWVFGSDGLRMYIDGKNVMGEAGVISGVRQFNRVRLMGNWSNQMDAADFKLYFDDIRVWDGVSAGETITTPPYALKANPSDLTQVLIAGDDFSISDYHGTLQLSAAALPSGLAGADYGIVWSVENLDGEATITQGGLLTAVKSGLVRVTAASVQNPALRDSRTVTITNNSVLSIEPVGGVAAISAPGGQLRLKMVSDPQMDFQYYDWTLTDLSGNETDIALLARSAGGLAGPASNASNDSLLTAIQDGAVRVTAASKQFPEMKATLDISISGQGVKLTGVSPVGASTGVGEEVQLTAALTPENAANKTLTWSVENSGGTNAVIDPYTGRLSAGSVAGRVAVTARANDGTGITGSAIVTITRPAGAYVSIESAEVSDPQAGYPASSALDGDQNTAWRSSVAANRSITIRLARAQTIDSLMYVPEQGSLGLNGAITQYRIETSLDGVSFTEAASGVWKRSTEAKGAAIRPVSAVYVRLSTPNNGGAYVSASEIKIGLGENGTGALEAAPGTYKPVIAANSEGKQAWKQLFVPTKPGTAGYSNDHTIWKGTDGRWHMVGITGSGSGHERAQYHAVSDNLLGPWAELEPVTDYQHPDPAAKLAKSGGRDDRLDTHAPHAVIRDGVTYLIYRSDYYHGMMNSLALDTTSDMENWTQRLDINYTISGFDEVNVLNDLYKRDINVIEIDGTYYMYSVAMDYSGSGHTGNGRSAVSVFESKDLINWTFKDVVLTTSGTATNAGWSAAESPFVFRYGEKYYLSVTLTDSGAATYHDTFIFESDNPFDFGDFNGNTASPANEHYVTRLDVHAPEFVYDAESNKWYVTTCGWPANMKHYIDGTTTLGRGVLIAELSFERLPQTETAVYDCELTVERDAAARFRLPATGAGLTFAIETQPAHGAISDFDVLTGEYTYTPEKGYVGADAFTFSAGGKTAAIRITVIDAMQTEVGVTVTVTPGTIVAGLSAYINVDADIQGLDGWDSAVAYLVKDGTRFGEAFPVIGGRARIYTSAAPEAGTLGIAVDVYRLSELVASGLGSIEVVPYNTDIWTAAHQAGDGKLVITFNEAISPKAGGYALTIDGKAFHCTQTAANELTADISRITAPGPHRASVKGVKYPRLFPSYSFTFTVDFVIEQP